MEFVENIGEKEYEEFVSNHHKAHFMQSYYFGEVMKYKHFEPYYVGLKDNGKLVATALLLKKKLFKGLCYYYCPRGYILDYNNLSLIKIFTKKLKKYSKKNKSIFIKIDPDIKRHDLDSKGNILGNDNYKLINYLLKLGYKHKGYNIDFSNEQPRFTFRLDLNEDFDKIYYNIHPTTRKILNKKNEYDLDTYIGLENDIDSFYKTMEETAERENLICSPISYYKNFHLTLKTQNMSDLYIVKVNIPNLQLKLENKIKEIENKITIVLINQNKKSENKIKELSTELNKLKKDLDTIKEIKDEEIILSSIITVKYKDIIWTVHGGNSNKLRWLNANYWLYYTIIKDAYDNGYKIVDFFGTSGIANPKEDDPIYGIHGFKKRFGGEYTEFIGEFDLICNKLLYFAFNILIPIRRKIIKAKLRSKNNV